MVGINPLGQITSVILIALASFLAIKAMSFTTVIHHAILRFTALQRFITNLCYAIIFVEDVFLPVVW